MAAIFSSWPPLCRKSKRVQEEEDKESRHSCEFHSALAIATHPKCTTNGQVKTLDAERKRTLPVGHAIQSARASRPFVEISRTNPKLFLEFHFSAIGV